MENAAHDMHMHSRLALEEKSDVLDSRQARILTLLKRAGRALTAREILDRLNHAQGTVIQDMNYVRPRITELKKAKLITEVRGKKAKDTLSGRQVALFVACPQATQIELL